MKLLNSKKRLGLAVAAALSASFVSAIVGAQEAPAEQLEEVLVTGSRIAQSNLFAPTPITTVTADAIEFTGAVNIADVLRTLPAVTTGISGNNSNFSTAGAGLNTLALRNLGTDRTLVLVNGRRYVSGSDGSGSVDFNTIPTELIKNVEVITGGASAIYGSDALAGVVNIALQDDFEGIRLNVQSGSTFDGGGDNDRISLTMGSNFADDRGNAVLSLIYSNDDGIAARERPETRIDDLAACYFGGECDESQEPFYSSFSEKGRFNIISTGQRFTVLDDGTVDSFDGVRDGFNRQAFRLYSIPTERKLATALFNFDLNDNVKAFSELTYARTDTSTELEPFPFAASDAFIDGLSVNNAYMPQEIRDAAIAAGDEYVDFARRTTELDQRGSTAARETFCALFGLEGKIDENWSWNAFASYGSMEDNQQGTGQINVLTFQQAIDTIDGDGDPATFDPICASEAARLAGCVPINLFGAGSISPEAAKYVRAPSLRNQSTEQTNLGINFTGTLVELPAGPLGVAVGYEYRDEYAEDIPDALTRTGLNAGNAEDVTMGGFDVNEFYMEANIPLLAGMPLVEELSVGAAYRYADYSSVGNTEAFTGRLSWAPVEQLRFRAQFARAVRAPNIGELFAPGGENFAPVSDPCDGITATSTGTVAQNCLADPYVAARVAATGSFDLEQVEIQGTGGFTGKGNPLLEAEESDSYTLGFVFTDEFDGFGAVTASVDWYQIEIDNLIDTVGRQTSVDLCYDSTRYPNSFCGFITRDARGPEFQQGEITEVNSGYANEGKLETSGVDVQVSWLMPFRPMNGDVSLAVNYSYLSEYKQTTFGETTDFSGEQGLPENRALITALYTNDRLTLQWQTEYTDEVTVSNTDDYGFTIGDYIVHDVFGSYRVTDEVTLAAGVNNVLEEDAPVILTGIPGNTTGWDTNATVYSAGAIGRSYYLNLNYQF